MIWIVSFSLTFVSFSFENRKQNKNTFQQQTIWRNNLADSPTEQCFVTVDNLFLEHWFIYVIFTFSKCLHGMQYAREMQKNVCNNDIVLIKKKSVNKKTCNFQIAINIIFFSFYPFVYNKTALFIAEKKHFYIEFKKKSYRFIKRWHLFRWAYSVRLLKPIQRNCFVSCLF